MHQLGASGANQTAEAQDLSLTQLDVDILQAVAGEMLGAEDHFVAAGRLGGIGLGQLTAYHQTDEALLVCLVNAYSGNILAVTEDGDSITNFKQLFQTMRYIDDGNAFRLQFADDLKQALLLLHSDRGGGLVHNNQLGVFDHGLGDLNDLAVCHGQLADQSPGRNMAAEPLQQLLSFFVAGLVVHENALGIVHAHEDVVHDGHGFHLDHFLIDHGDAQVQSLGRLQVGIAFAVDGDLTGIRMDRPGNDLDKGRLSGAVLTYQCVYLTLLKGNGYIVQRRNAGVELGDVFQFQFRGKRLLSVRLNFNI